MENRADIPPFLSPARGFEGIGSFRILECFATSERFSNEYNIESEIAFAAMLAGLSHSIGGAVVVDSALGQISPPFSLLMVTPEAAPVWTRVPIRFLAEDFAGTIKMLAGLKDLHAQNSKSNGEGAAESPEQKQLRERIQVAHELYSLQISERIATPSVVPPFPRLPFDHHVLLTTPAVGLRRALRQLNSDQRVRLEVALCMNRAFPAMSDEPSGAAPNFFWQVQREEAAAVFRENSWLAGVPFLMLETQNSGTAKLAAQGGVSTELHHLCQHLFQARYRAMSSRTTLRMDTRAFQPLQEFLESAQGWTPDSCDRISIQPARVVEQALRFTQLFAVLQKRLEPDPVIDVIPGLELAKRLAARHFRTLMKFLPSQSAHHLPDISGLSERDQATFLKICERPGISPSELSRSFNRMRQAERDEILCRLFQRSLIESRDGGLWKAEL